MRFRQVHLDFHTSELIEHIGSEFDKKDFQEKLKTGHVDSITVTAKCAHGWSYYDSKALCRHPYLEYDLLEEMIEAAHEIDVKVPVYVSVALSEKDVRNHPEWLIRSKDEKTTWVSSLMDAGWHRFCMNNAYQDLVIGQIEEVVVNYELDGLFLDVSSIVPCYCQSCVKTLIQRDLDPEDMENIWNLAEEVYLTFAERVKKLVHSIKPGLPIFHNGGHIQRGRRDLAAMDTHLELESLPTGGWGYDHLPLSALYVKNLGMEYLGMTGKFHTEWGEFGGFKHPNGLLYETSLFLAYGAKCSVGDQLHPGGRMDAATYELIGSAYSEVEQKEPYIKNTRMVQDIAILSLEALGSRYQEHNLIAQAEKATLEADYFRENLISQASRSDVGALRLLKECGYLFDIIDTDMDFDDYKVILIPDYGTVDEELEQKLKSFMERGGRLYLSGISGTRRNGGGFIEGIGLQYLGESEFDPLYLKPKFPMKNFGTSSFVVYGKAHRVETETAQCLGVFQKPYFNRTAFHFCSHMHAPCSNEKYGPGILSTSEFTYIAFHLFEEYEKNGSFVVKDIFRYTMNALLGVQKTIHTNMPSNAVVTLAKHEKHPYYVNHLLYGAPVRRGHGLEVIEDIVPLHQVEISLCLAETVKRVSLVPQEQEIPFTCENGRISYQVPQVKCHQMVKIEYDNNQ